MKRYKILVFNEFDNSYLSMNEKEKKVMKCPVCGKEMILGNIQSDREVMWLEDDKKPKRITTKLFLHSKANAERCEECRIVVVKEEQ